MSKVAKNINNNSSCVSIGVKLCCHVESSCVVMHCFDWVALFSEFIGILHKSPVVDGPMRAVGWVVLSVVVGSAIELVAVFKLNRAIQELVEA